MKKVGLSSFKIQEGNEQHLKQRAAQTLQNSQESLMSSQSSCSSLGADAIMEEDDQEESAGHTADPSLWKFEIIYPVQA